MDFKIQQLIFAILSLLLLGGCVSVQLETGQKTTRSTNVELSPPEAPFQPFEQAHMDRAWKNRENGNTITYLSECKEDSEVDLASIRDSIIFDLKEAKIDSVRKLKYNQSQALRSKVSARLDDVTSFLDLLIFKKDNCLYILTYVGLADAFSQNHDEFERFVEGFRVP